MFNLIPWKRKSKGDDVALATRPSDPLTRFRDEVDALFDRFFRDAPDFDPFWKGWPAATGEGPLAAWGFEVDDRENEMVVRAEAPGFEPDDFDVQVIGNSLVLRAEHKQESRKKNGFSYRYGSFHRVVPLPEGVEADRIDARYRRGVLEVSVPKGERARGKRIPVKMS